MKAKITTFIYCLAAQRQAENNGAINAIGILPVMTPEFIPSAFSFSIILGINGIDSEKDHIMGVTFYDNKGNVLVDVDSISISAEAMQKEGLDLPKEEKGLLMSMELKNVLLMEEGKYKTKVTLDEDILGEYEIYVKAKPRI